MEYCATLREENLVAGRGNPLLTLLSKTGHGGSMILNSGDCAGQGRSSSNYE